jgi:hypothetical protein
MNAYKVDKLIVRLQDFRNRLEGAGAARSDDLNAIDTALMLLADLEKVWMRRRSGRGLEKTCQECGGGNPSWHAPNELWNQVTGHPPGLIICPSCFERRAEAMGLMVHAVVKLFSDSERE